MPLSPVLKLSQIESCESTGVVPAQLSDIAASGILLGVASNAQNQILDTQTAYVDTPVNQSSLPARPPLLFQYKVELKRDIIHLTSIFLIVSIEDFIN